MKRAFSQRRAGVIIAAVLEVLIPVVIALLLVGSFSRVPSCQVGARGEVTTLL